MNILVIILFNFSLLAAPTTDFKSLDESAPKVKMVGVMSTGTVIYMFKEGEISITERRSQKYLEKENPAMLKALVKSYDNNREWVEIVPQTDFQ